MFSPDYILVNTVPRIFEKSKFRTKVQFIGCDNMLNHLDPQNNESRDQRLAFGCLRNLDVIFKFLKFMFMFIKIFGTWWHKSVQHKAGGTSTLQRRYCISLLFPTERCNN